MNRTKTLAAILLVLAISGILALVVNAAQAPQTLQVNGASTNVNVSPASLIWSKVYGGPEDDRLYSMITAGDGYLAVGSSTSMLANTTVGWALRLDSDGNAAWNKTFLVGSGTELRYAINLTDGFLFVGNEFMSSGGINGYVAKIDDQGNLLWQTIIGNNQTDEFYSAIAASDGFVLLGLSSNNGGNQPQAWVVKINLDGNVIWDNTYSFAQDTVAKSGILSPDGDYMVAGYTDPITAGNYRFLLMKITPDGNLVWNQTYGGDGSQEAHSMTSAPDGYVIVGDTQTSNANIHAWVLKVDFNGAQLWAETVGGKNADSPSFVTPASGGGYLVSGFTFSWGAGNRDFWLFKISDSGQVSWSCTQGNKGYQESYAILPAGQNQYIMAGWTDPPNQPALIGKHQYNWWIIKIDAPQNSDSFSILQLLAFGLLFSAAVLAALIIVLKARRKHSPFN